MKQPSAIITLQFVECFAGFTDDEYFVQSCETFSVRP
jgi:hypothetical protein